MLAEQKENIRGQILRDKIDTYSGVNLRGNQKLIDRHYI